MIPTKARATRFAALFCVALAPTAAFAAGPPSLLGIGGGASAPASAASEAAGNGEFYRLVMLACAGSSCSAEVAFNANRKTTVNFVGCAIVSSASQAIGVQIRKGTAFLDLFPIDSRAINAGSETAIVRSSTSVVMVGGTLTFDAFSGTPSGANCILKGKTEKK